MTNYYVTEGIDQRKLSEDAMKISKDGTVVVVHYHGYSESCSGMLHKTYDHGECTVSAPLLGAS